MPPRHGVKGLGAWPSLLALGRFAGIDTRRPSPRLPLALDRWVCCEGPEGPCPRCRACP